MANSTLIFIPTYNEHENVGGMLAQLLALGLPADILFLDDNSPDGTGQLLDSLAAKHDNVQVIHRSGKLGIGTAHVQGISYAYDHGYQTLITMDCDFTHSPADIAAFIEAGRDADIVVGSRYMKETSLKTWNFYRKLLTKAGHACTRIFLKMPYDATGAFRLYRLDKLPRSFLAPIGSRGYSFFFESLHLLVFNGFKIREVAIDLPARVYGHSKMRLSEAFHSLTFLIHTWFTVLVNRERFEIAEPFVPDGAHVPIADKQDWESYWAGKNRPAHLIYDLIAAFYRKAIIKPSLNRAIFRHFDGRSRLLHAGCGSGQVDRDIGMSIGISALDISPEALSIYKKANKNYRELIHGSIFAMPLADESYDGIYNLGVMEHFTEDEIQAILEEFKRVLKPGGKIVMFWPPEFGLSVIVLKGVHFVLNRVMKKDISLHPPEITRVRSKRQIRALLHRAGLGMMEYRFGPRDLFTYVVVTAVKTGHA